MSGKKQEKFRITLNVCCNADGSEKRPLMFIGYSKNPRCFKKRGPKERGFYYRNNKKAWMTAALFEEYTFTSLQLPLSADCQRRWVEEFDDDMRRQNRHILLIMDNFSGHRAISYKPTNIRIEFFAANMTSHIQPCDAGIIRTFKAHYRRSFCLRAIDLDEAGEPEIYKIDLLEAMMMAKDAWDSVSKETIVNCWKHVQILPTDRTQELLMKELLEEEGIQADESTAHTDHGAKDLSARLDDHTWDLLECYASTNMTLPEVERLVMEHIGESDTTKFCIHESWMQALRIVDRAEDNMDYAIKGVKRLRASYAASISPPSLVTPSSLPNPEYDSLARDVAASINVLKSRNRIFGLVPTVEEFVNPDCELEFGAKEFDFPGGDEEIAAQVQHEEAVARGDVIEIESDDDSIHEEAAENFTTKQTIHLCEQLERAALSAPVDVPLEMIVGMRKMRAALGRYEMKNAKQTTLDAMWKMA